MSTIDARKRCSNPPARRRLEAGFTLIEIMVVMAIIVALFSIVGATAGTLRSKAAHKATVAMIEKIVLALDEYKSLTGTYPPDGIDYPVQTTDGHEIKGSACLYYFLTVKPWKARDVVAGKVRLYEVPPKLDLRASEVSTEDPDYPGVHEVLDGFATPIHYDNTEDGKFMPQGGEVHYPPLDERDHPPDPRLGDLVVDGVPAVRRAGIQSVGYDLWSHGVAGHEMDTVSLPIGTWNYTKE